jgi:hypothetical protein
MVRVRTLATTALLLGSALLIPAHASAQEFKGQLKIGMHRLKMQPGTLYQIMLDAPPGPFPVVDVPGGRLSIVLGSDIRNDKMYFVPDNAQEYTFYVYPPFGGGAPGGAQTDTINYTLKFKALPLDSQPVLKEQTKLTEQDPIHPERKAYYKTFKVPMKANKVYVIEMTRVSDNRKIEPFLYLEGPDGKIVRQDDAGNADRQARIVFVPMQDGEYRVLATSFQQATGDILVQVRTAGEGSSLPPRERDRQNTGKD